MTGLVVLLNDCAIIKTLQHDLPSVSGDVIWGRINWGSDRDFALQQNQPGDPGGPEGGPPGREKAWRRRGEDGAIFHLYLFAKTPGPPLRWVPPIKFSLRHLTSDQPLGFTHQRTTLSRSVEGGGLL
jgi:hypothetical protein